MLFWSIDIAFSRILYRYPGAQLDLNPARLINKLNTTQAWLANKLDEYNTVEDGEVEDGEVKDGEVEDGEVKDGEVEDGEVEGGAVEWDNLNWDNLDLSALKDGSEDEDEYEDDDGDGSFLLDKFDMAAVLADYPSDQKSESSDEGISSNYLKTIPDKLFFY